MTSALNRCHHHAHRHLAVYISNSQSTSVFISFHGRLFTQKTPTGASSSPCSTVSAAAGIVNCASMTSANILTRTDTGISASCLTSVGGNLNIDGNTNQGGNNTVLKTIVLPLLTYVAGYFQVWNGAGGFGNAMLTILDVHSLAFVGGYMYLDNNGGLTSFSMPVLTFVGQYFDISSNHNLATLSAPALVKIANNGGNSYAVAVCDNTASFSFSATISHAAAGKSCILTNSCSATTNCT